MNGNVRRMGRVMTWGMAIACASQIGCTTAPPQDRGLKITEVHETRIELYVDEPAGKKLHIGGNMRVWTKTNDGNNVQTHAVNLSVSDATLDAGTFFVIWEDRNYQGPPVKEDFQGGIGGAVPGIKVARNTLGELDDFPSEVGLTGIRSRVSRMIVLLPEFTEDRVSDVVRFGLPQGDRPVSQGGGAFQANGTLDNPTGSTSIQRIWSGGKPTDNDQESDWKRALPSWGAPTN